MPLEAGIIAGLLFPADLLLFQPRLLDEVSQGFVLGLALGRQADLCQLSQLVEACRRKWWRLASKDCVIA